VHAGLALVGEQDRAVGQELQVVQPLEALAVDRAEDGLDRVVSGSWLRERVKVRPILA